MHVTNQSLAVSRKLVRVYSYTRCNVMENMQCRSAELYLLLSFLKSRQTDGNTLWQLVANWSAAARRLKEFRIIHLTSFVVLKYFI